MPIEEVDNSNYKQEEILRIALETYASKRTLSENTPSLTSMHQPKQSKKDPAPDIDKETDSEYNEIDTDETEGQN